MGTRFILMVVVLWDDERGYSWTVVLGTVGGRKTLDFGGGIEFGRKMRGGGGRRISMLAFDSL